MSECITTIYLDLDETLIHTEVTKDKPTSSDRIDFKIGGYWYSTKLRLGALELISFCKSIAPTKILTNSTDVYSKYISDAFNFGFKSEDIISRDDYITWEPEWPGSVYEIACVKESINQPCAILVDNLFPFTNGAIQKMNYLGINSDRYIQISEFIGNESQEEFKKELEIIKTSIKEKINALD